MLGGHFGSGLRISTRPVLDRNWIDVPDGARDILHRCGHRNHRGLGERMGEALRWRPQRTWDARHEGYRSRSGFGRHRVRSALAWWVPGKRTDDRILGDTRCGRTLRV